MTAKANSLLCRMSMGLMLSLTKADIHLSVICFFFFYHLGLPRPHTQWAFKFVAPYYIVHSVQ